MSIIDQINRQRIFAVISKLSKRERMACIISRKESKHRVLTYIKFKNSLNIVRRRTKSQEEMYIPFKYLF